jgi:hypothetical protein
VDLFEGPRIDAAGCATMASRMSRISRLWGERWVVEDVAPGYRRLREVQISVFSFQRQLDESSRRRAARPRLRRRVRVKYWRSAGFVAASEAAVVCDVDGAGEELPPPDAMNAITIKKPFIAFSENP